MVRGEAAIIFPHQLFLDHPALARDRAVYLVEDPHFFADSERNIRFHKKKLVLHLASIQAYQERLKSRAYQVKRIPFTGGPKQSDLFHELAKEGIKAVYLADPVDVPLEKRVNEQAPKQGIQITTLESPGFLTPKDWIRDFFKNAGHYSQTRFYIAQRKRLNILLEADGRPVGGRWSFDPQNRRRLPLNPAMPELPRFSPDAALMKIITDVEKRFPDHPGSAEGFFYPVNHEQARQWLEHFLHHSLAKFGHYQDAISKSEPFLFHSVLTPALNIGLLTPDEVVAETLAFSRKRRVPLNSLEGFLRQVIGWREFMRAVYLGEEKKQRSMNFWNHKRELPSVLYSGETGLDPLDTVIRRVIQNAYAHHIERLMILGNFMLLSEIDPNAVYRWFMEMFIDAYDWVMVPNVYGMSQYADGGLITTKPYISSSNYLRKMSDFPAGDWCAVWDGLYWRFVGKHRDFFLGNPRLRVMSRQYEKMNPERRSTHLKVAEDFLGAL